MPPPPHCSTCGRCRSRQDTIGGHWPVDLVARSSQIASRAGLTRTILARMHRSANGFTCPRNYSMDAESKPLLLCSVPFFRREWRQAATVARPWRMVESLLPAQNGAQALNDGPTVADGLRPGVTALPPTERLLLVGAGPAQVVIETLNLRHHRLGDRAVHVGVPASGAYVPGAAVGLVAL